MAQVLIFTNNEQVKLLKVRDYRNRISYLNANKEVKHLTVEMFFSTFLNGESGAVLVAADRYVSRDEILDAHESLIG